MEEQKEKLRHKIKSFDSDYCIITDCYGDSEYVNIQYSDFEWYEEYDKLLAFDYDMLCGCLRIDYFDEFIKTPQEVIDELTCIFDKFFCLSTKNGTIVYVNSSLNNETIETLRMICNFFPDDYAIEVYSTLNKTFE